jgi:quinol monooxygenase YgiN
MSGTRRLASAACAAIATGIGAVTAMAQTPQPSPPPPESPYAITYIEVAPKSADAARKLLRTYRDAARKAQGVVEFAAFERIGYPNHFVIVEQWAGAKARESNAGSTYGAEFRKALTPLLIAGYDERPHYAMTIGAKGAGAVYAVTHVDLIPPRREEGAAATKALAEKARGGAGNTRFDVLVQGSRSNHFTVIESWQTAAAQSAHTAAPHTVAYRIQLMPMGGSLYDERLYRVLR